MSTPFRRCRPRSVKPGLGPRINRSSPLAAGLRGLWLFNEGVGQIVGNHAANNYPGTSSGALTSQWLTTPYGPGLTFDGTSSYIASVGTVADFGFLVSTGIFTIAARFQLYNPSADAASCVWGGSGSSVVKDAAIFYENRSAVSSPKAIRLFVGSGTSGQQIAAMQTANNAITDTSWHHVVVVANNPAANGAIYVDGAAQAIASSTFNGTPSGPLAAAPDIGRLASGSFFFNGAMDHVMVWDRALSASEAASLYLNPYQVVIPAPGAWQFNFPAAAPSGTLLWHLRRMSGGFQEMDIA